jgi:hypothetical protein
MLCDEHWMLAIGCLAAIAAWFGRGQPLFDQFLRVHADSCDATETDHFPVLAKQTELCAELVLAKPPEYCIKPVH